MLKLDEDTYQLVSQNIINSLGQKWSKLTDGDHTINDLYDHRVVLTASLFNLAAAVKDFSLWIDYPHVYVWKSWRHYDGSMFDNYFICGMSTPDGDISYHYEARYWNLFKCRELEYAPRWDGHSPADVLDRLAKTFCGRDFREVKSDVTDKHKE